MGLYGSGLYGSGPYGSDGGQLGGSGGSGGGGAQGGSPAVTGSPIYRFLCADLVTNAILAELPFRHVSFERKLNDVGTFKGVLPIADPKVVQMQALAATQPGRTALYVDRSGTLLWGGIIVTRRYKASDHFQIEVGASEFFWYFKQKRVITATRNYVNVDQLNIAADLIVTAQSVPGGNIGVTLNYNPSGVVRSQKWAGTELKRVGQAIIDLSQLDNGFDFAIDVAYVSGVPTKTLTLSYPRRGAVFSSTGWTFEYPGNVVDYTWPEDSEPQAITAYVQGSGTGTNMIIGSNSVTSLIDGGYPLLEDTFSAKDQTDASVINARAVAAAKAYSNPITLPQLLVRADLDPVLGSYTIGDDVLVRISDPRFPVSGGVPGLSSYYRITAIRVEPQQETTPERVTLTLGATLQ